MFGVAHGEIVAAKKAARLAKAEARIIRALSSLRPLRARGPTGRTGQRGGRGAIWLDRALRGQDRFRGRFLKRGAFTCRPDGPGTAKGNEPLG